MESFPELSDAQIRVYKKLKKLFGLDYIKFIMSQGPEILHTRLEALKQYESFLIGQVQEHERASIPTRYIFVPESEPKAHPLAVSVPAFEGKEGDNLPFWITQMHIAATSAQFLTEPQKVAMAISQLGCRAREYALLCNSDIEDDFPSWDSLK